MNQQVISALAGLGSFGLFALLVRVLPRRWTTPAPPISNASKGDEK